MLASYVALIFALFMYHLRKVSTVYFDAKTDTPSDYTVFVVNLPELTVDVSLAPRVAQLQLMPHCPHSLDCLWTTMRALSLCASTLKTPRASHLQTAATLLCSRSHLRCTMRNF